MKRKARSRMISAMLCNQKLLPKGTSCGQRAPRPNTKSFFRPIEMVPLNDITGDELFFPTLRTLDNDRSVISVIKRTTHACACAEKKD